MHSEAQYRDVIHDLLPPGKIFPASEDDSVLGGVFDVVAKRLFTANVDADYMLNDIFPDAVGAFIGDWERVMNLPRPGITGQTDSERVATIKAWLNISPYSNKQFFLDIATLQGFSVKIQEQSDEGIDTAVNGDFATDSDWTKGTGWTIAAGVASKAAGTASDLSETQDLSIGVDYDIEFTVSNYVAGPITPLCGSTGTGTARSANGTFLETITCAGDTDLYLSAGATFDGDIDDVSIKLSATLNAHEWRVNSTNAESGVWARAGDARAGDPIIGDPVDEVLESLILFFAPAHTKVLFKYS